MKLLIAIVFLLSFSGAHAASTCALCNEVDTMRKAYDDDELKAYEAFNKFLSQAKLSKNKKVLAQELKSIVKASVAFLKSDERQELPSYLLDMQQENPKEFNEALKDLSPTEKTDLEARMKAAKDVLEKGEEP